jgi:DNA invertase Pin-like site-specific DNA recombinase
VNYGYARVSSRDQNLDRQIESLSEYVSAENIICDKASGKNFNRKGYKKLLETLKEGDVLYLHSLDRLGREYDKVADEWDRITKEIKADIVIIDMPILDTRKTAQSLDGKFISDLVMAVLRYVSQKERDNTRKRQAEGIAIAKAKGVRFGAEKTISLPPEIVEKVESGEMSVSGACRELGISRSSWYNEMKAR